MIFLLAPPCALSKHSLLRCSGFQHSMSFPRYWPYDRPPEFVQCVRSFAEAHLLRQLHFHAFTFQQPVAPPRVCSDWYVPPRAISEAAHAKKRRLAVRGAAPQATVACNDNSQQAEQRLLKLAAWMRVRVGTAGFISKLLLRLFACRGFQRRDVGQVVRFTLWRTCSAIMCSRAFPSMRARPCAADTAEAALIVVRRHFGNLYTFSCNTLFPTIRSKWPNHFCGTEHTMGQATAFAVHRGTAT